MRRFLLLSLSALLAASCVDQNVPIKTLAELVTPFWDIRVHQDQTATLTLEDYDCFLFGGEATLDGVLLEKISSGGEETSFGLGKGLVPGSSRECIPIQWTIPAPLPDEPRSDVSIHDESGEIRFTVLNFGANHAFLPPPGPMALSWGGSASLQWAVGTDWPSNNRRVLDAGTEAFDLFQTTDPSRYPFYDDAGTYHFFLPDTDPDGGTPALLGAELIVTSYNVVIGSDCPDAGAPGVYCGLVQEDFEHEQHFAVDLQ